MDQLHDIPKQDCPSDADLRRVVLQGKWRLRVLQEIAKGPVRLSHLRRVVPQCSKKVLIDTLHGLEELSWIEVAFANILQRHDGELSKRHHLFLTGVAVSPPP